MKNLSLQVNDKKVKKNGKIDKIKRRFLREKQIWLISIPIILWVLVFAYYPMYGVFMAFVDYIPGKSILQCDWAGLKYFKQFFESPDFFLIIRNTLVISGLNLLIVFPAPIFLSLLINELRMKYFKKTVQTISYLPHFISWVVAASLIYSLLSSEGLITTMLMKAGIIDSEMSILGEGKYFWAIITSANLWKSVGWSSIIYLAAMAGIDKGLYEAGEVDGLGRFGKIWHITLPGIRTTIILLFILNIGSILNAGFEQQLLLGSDQTREYWDVIDTYAYRYGIQLGRYSYATAISFIKSTIGLALIFSVNRLSKKLFDLSVI
ncbi:ABC transporter permease [Oceanirhabdus sp. W0125-5]|uniref:ABC transporter permease n=1 Tax=Oceanirhabdus sp. W0125-5 TaxID=2999116 RepID=UPI0022F2E80A|nr:ABC transporter permease subunit [Oceanirhabdus sp. W0125-5]WBW99082.1 ABC transporter permease subunit [Oceanirhabdus sp. W0125-5]